jgi:hypothetical protein
LPTVEGKILEDKFPKPQPAADPAAAGSVPWLWLALGSAALALLTFGWFSRRSFH